MKGKNEPYIFYIIAIIILFAATLYMVPQMKSSSPAVKEVKEAVTLQDVAVNVALVSFLFIFTAGGIYGMAHHIYCGYKGIKLFGSTRIKRHNKN